MRETFIRFSWWKIKQNYTFLQDFPWNVSSFGLKEVVMFDLVRELNVLFWRVNKLDIFVFWYVSYLVATFKSLNTILVLFYYYQYLYFWMTCSYYNHHRCRLQTLELGFCVEVDFKCRFLCYYNQHSYFCNAVKFYKKQDIDIGDHFKFWGRACFVWCCRRGILFLLVWLGWGHSFPYV